MTVWNSVFAGPVTCKVISIDHYKAVIEVTARKNSLYRPGHRMLVSIDQLYDKYYPRKYGGLAIGKEWLNNFKQS